MGSVQPQLSHHSDLLHIGDFISMRTPTVCDSGQSADQSMFCSARTEILSTKIVIRKVEKVCDLLTSIFQKQRARAKLKTMRHQI